MKKTVVTSVASSVRRVAWVIAGGGPAGPVAVLAIGVMVALGLGHFPYDSPAV